MSFQMNSFSDATPKSSPGIPANQVESLFETKFIKLFDLQYAPGAHYFDATRRNKEDLVAIKSDAEFQSMLADAVSCIVILDEKNPQLLLSYEYRYPAGRYLLSVPAGLIDPEDAQSDSPLINTAKREILEETGLTIQSEDSFRIVNPLLFSTPGMTDESNALVCAIIKNPDLTQLNQEGALGSEAFDGFCLVSLEEARKLLETGTDERNNYYSVYTWAALMYFVSGMWR